MMRCCPQAIKWLRDITSYYSSLYNEFKADDELEITVSYRLRTGYFYRGKYKDVLHYRASASYPQKELHLKRLMIALIERMALFDKLTFSKFSEQLRKSSEVYETVIHTFHESYTTLARQKYNLLKKTADIFIARLIDRYSKNSSNVGQVKLLEYLQLLLMGDELKGEKELLKELCEDLSSEKEADLKKKFKELCAQRKLKKKRLKEALLEQGMEVGKLTRDAQYCAKLINQHQSQLDKQFRDYKKDINRLAQMMGVSRLGLKHRKVDFFHDGSLSYDEHFTPSYAPSEREENDSLNESGVSPKKQHNRDVKRRVTIIATVVAILLGFGEASVAAIGMFAACTNPMVLLLVFASAFYANYYLVRKDTIDVITKIISGKLFYDSEGNFIGWPRAIAVSVLAIGFSIGSGTVYAALSANCFSQTAAGVLSYILPTLLSSHIAITLASVIATATAIGLGVIFFIVVGDFIINKRWEGIAEYFQQEWLLNKDLRHEMTAADWAKHLLGILFIKLPKLIFAVGLAAAITAVSFGVFYEKTLPLVQHIANGNFAAQAARTLTVANAVVMFVFGTKKNQQSANNLSPSSILTAPVNFLLGALLFPFGVLEMLLRNTVLRPFTEERAAVWAGDLLGASCEKFAEWVDQMGKRLPSWLKYQHTYCDLDQPAANEGAANTSVGSGIETTEKQQALYLLESSGEEKGEPEMTLQPGARLQKLNRSYTLFYRRLMPNAIDWNTGGQVSLFMLDPAGASCFFPYFGYMLAQIIAGLSEAIYSRQPNKLALEKSLAETEVGLPQLPQLRVVT